MKKVISILLVIFSLNSFSQSSDGFYDTPDSKLHTKYSFLIGNITYLVAVEEFNLTPAEGIIVSTGFDIAGVSFKELVIDQRWSWKDMGHNMVGILAGKLTMFLFQSFVNKSSKSYKYRKSRTLNYNYSFYSLELKGKL